MSRELESEGLKTFSAGLLPGEALSVRNRGKKLTFAYIATRRPIFKEGEVSTRKVKELVVACNTPVTVRREGRAPEKIAGMNIREGRFGLVNVKFSPNLLGISVDGLNISTAQVITPTGEIGMLLRVESPTELLHQRLEGVTKEEIKGRVYLNSSPAHQRK